MKFSLPISSSLFVCTCGFNPYNPPCLPNCCSSSISFQLSIFFSSLFFTTFQPFFSLLLVLLHRLLTINFNSNSFFLSASILYINSLSLSVSQSWAWVGIRHGLGTGRLGLKEGHNTGKLGTSTSTSKLGTDWARASWAQSDCVRTSRVPISSYSIFCLSFSWASIIITTHVFTTPTWTIIIILYIKANMVSICVDTNWALPRNFFQSLPVPCGAGDKQGRAGWPRQPLWGVARGAISIKEILGENWGTCI